MGTGSVTLVDALRQYRLLEADQLTALTRELQAGSPDPRTFAKELLRRGWLSAYQVNQLLQGRAQDLLLGSYVLLERLGEGGMGQVFKARNWKLGNIVAVKVIRPERVANPNALRRFHREIRVAGQLNHPNIVRALDADQVNGAPVLVMEYVDGADLARLVRQSGALPIREACDYISQAALGLQHAHEQGLIHRDIKPSNLIRTSHGSVVKILDLGLARLADSEEGQSTCMTQMGSIVGSPDFIAPEQARDSHSADIRADIYSLGCSLYFLLAGQVPFPGGTGTEKLLSHHMEEPPPVEQLRPEVPPTLAALVRKLMAKRPEERYQTPVEVVVALGAFLSTSRVPAAITQRIPIPPALRGTSTKKFAIPVDSLRRGAARRRWSYVAAAVLFLLLGGVALSWAVLNRSKDRPANTPLAEARETRASAASRPTLASTKTSQPEEHIDLVSPKDQVVVLGDQSLGTVNALAISRDGQVLAATAADNTIHLWDTANWRERAALRGHVGEIRTLAFAPDGRQLASGSADQTVKVWDLSSGKASGTFPGHTGTVRAVAISPDGHTLVSGADRDANIRVWDLLGKKEPAVWTGHEGGVHALAFSADGQMLASAGIDRLIRLWDMDSGKERAVLKGHTSDIISLAYAADGKKIASGTSGGVLRVWNPATQTNRRLKGGKSSVIALAFTPDSQRLFSAGIRGAVTAWDLDNESRVQEWTFPKSVHSIALDPKASYLAVGTAAGTIHILRPDTGKVGK
jgi:serine/threonine-protein kinase